MTNLSLTILVPIEKDFDLMIIRCLENFNINAITVILYRRNKSKACEYKFKQTNKKIAVEFQLNNRFILIS